MTAMRPVFSTLIFAALNAIVSGQSLLSTTFAPKSQCGIGALQCYNEQQDVMNDKFNALDFESGCQIYKTIVICMNNLPDCLTDADFMTVSQEVSDDQEGVCGEDGSVQSCGLDIKTCFTDVKNAFADALVKNFSLACSMLSSAITCADKVTSTKECADTITKKLSQAEPLIDETTMAAGCDGACAQAIGNCTLNAATLPTDQSISNMDLRGFCQSAYKVYNCINNLTTSPACITSDGKVDVTFLKAAAQNEITKVGDICSADGTTTPCVADLVQCSDELTGITSTSDSATICSVTSEFLECISKLPCTNALAPLVANMRTSLKNDETENHCPSVGSCNDRFATCGKQEQGLQNVDQSNAAQICSQAKGGLSCFDSIKKDPYCINELNSFTTEEQSLQRLISLQCGCKGLHPSSLLLATVTLVAAYLKTFF